MHHFRVYSHVAARMVRMADGATDVIDIANDKLVLLKKAAALLPNRPHLATLYRWADGIDVKPRRKRGQPELRPVRLKLETIVIGDDRYTSLAALQRFCEERTAALDGRPIDQPQLVRGTRDRRQDLAKAKEQLAKAGL